MNKTVRDNLMSIKDYSPYCGSIVCKSTPRTVFDGKQFKCPNCGWRSNFPHLFIILYKSKWNIK